MNKMKYTFLFIGFKNISLSIKVKKIVGNIESMLQCMHQINFPGLASTESVQFIQESFNHSLSLFVDTIISMIKVCKYCYLLFQVQSHGRPIFPKSLKIRAAQDDLQNYCHLNLGNTASHPCQLVNFSNFPSSTFAFLQNGQNREKEYKE